MGPDCIMLAAHVNGRGYSLLTKADPVCSQLMNDSMMKDRGERTADCCSEDHAIWWKEGYGVGRDLYAGGRRHWSLLTETRQLNISLITFCVQLSYHFCNSSHVVD